MNHTYAYLRNDHKIKFRMVSAQHFINEAPGTSLEQSIEGRYLNVRQRKQALYRQNGIITLSIDNCALYFWSLFLPSASCLYR